MTRDTDPDDRTDQDRLAGLGVTRRDDDARERTAERIRRAGSTDDPNPHARDGFADGGEVLEGALAVSSTYKVLGEIATTDATGVIGRTTATSSVTYGVLGRGESPSAQGVVGAASDSAPLLGFGGTPTGVWGFTDRSGADSGVDAGYGVYAQAAASSGEAYGVYGTTSSSADNAYGVYSDGDSKTDGDLEVTGSQSVGNLGLSAYRSSDQNVPDNTQTTIVFDGVDRDDFGAYDGTSGIFTVPTDGDYRVEVTINWADTFSTDFITHNLQVNHSPSDGFGCNFTGNDQVARSHSKTLFGLTTGDEIDIEVRHISGGSKNLSGSSGGSETFLTITKAG